AQPQPVRHGQGHRHPQTPGLALGVQLISLDVAQVHLLGVEVVLVDALAVGASLVLPGGHRALVGAERSDASLQGAACDPQGEDGDEQGALLVQAIKGGALAGREGLTAEAADVASRLVAVDLDVALAELSPGGAVGVVAECLGGVHGVPPRRSRLASLPVRMFPGPPLVYTLSTHSRFPGVLPGQPRSWGCRRSRRRRPRLRTFRPRSRPCPAGPGRSRVWSGT